MAPRLLTLPKVAEAIGVEYRTLHSWVEKGILTPSMQASSGAGVPNLFDERDAIAAKVIADLRETGVPLEQLREAATELQAHPDALTSGAYVLVNGSTSVGTREDALAAVERETLIVAYNTEPIIKQIRMALPGD
jgi:DNA-binding transcriptional MerR regulator